MYVTCMLMRYMGLRDAHIGPSEVRSTLMCVSVRSFLVHRVPRWELGSLASTAFSILPWSIMMVMYQSWCAARPGCVHSPHAGVQSGKSRLRPSNVTIELGGWLMMINGWVDGKGAPPNNNAIAVGSSNT